MKWQRPVAGIVALALATSLTFTLPLVAGAQPESNTDLTLAPRPNDELLISFELGEVRTPYVIGQLWSSDAPPE